MALKIQILRGDRNESQWLSVADIMSGLMMVFILLAISFISRYIDIQGDSPLEIDMIIAEIAKELTEEFGEDLRIWDAEFDGKRLEFRFVKEQVMFDPGKSELKPEYQAVLADFFPRYLETLKPYKKYIREIRIEGHTSSEWAADSSPTDAYFQNMRLSQERTRAVLAYTYQLPDVEAKGNLPWVRSDVVAVGLSSSKRILASTGIEDKVRSRRVTFRIVTNAEEMILCSVGYGSDCEKSERAVGQK